VKNLYNENMKLRRKKLKRALEDGKTTMIMDQHN
jgi:hypothetical protein